MGLLTEKQTIFYRGKCLSNQANPSVVYRYSALGSPYSHCFNATEGGGVGREGAHKLINPSPRLLREGFWFLLQCGRLDENVFPPLNGRKLKKSAF